MTHPSVLLMFSKLSFGLAIMFLVASTVAMICGFPYSADMPNMTLGLIALAVVFKQLGGLTAAAQRIEAEMLDMRAQIEKLETRL